MSFGKRGGAPDDDGAADDCLGGGAADEADEAADEGALLDAGLGELPDELGAGAGLLLLLLLPWARAVADNTESVTTAESRATRRSEGREERMMVVEIDRGWATV